MFEFATATRIVFGAGTLRSVPDLVAPARDAAVLLVRGTDEERARPLALAFASRGHPVHQVVVRQEPTLESVRELVARARAVGIGLVISCGGGSVIDAGKAVAILVNHPGDPLDYLEVVGAGRPLEHPGLPFVAIPTTAGTGAEVTRNAVLTVPATGAGRATKASLRSAAMLPRLAVVDPDLLAPLPTQVIAHSGLDALSQLIEPFISSRANPLTHAIAREGIRRSARALAPAYLEGLGTRADWRDDLAFASLCGGLCLANAGLGAVHGFAAPAGAMFGAPHGAVCAALLPHVLRANVRALRQRAADHPALARLDELAALVTGDDGRGDAAGPGGADDAVAWVVALCQRLAVPGLAHYGMTEADVPPLVAQARLASSMKGNPITLTDGELTDIARLAMTGPNAGPTADPTAA